MADRKRTAVDWEDVRVFLALARHGSLSAAARTLAVTHATVSRRLRSLEASIGGKLVERRPEGFVLTPVGIRTLDAAGDMDSAAQTLGHGDLDGTPTGLVRVNAPPGLALGFLIAQLAEVAFRYPALDLDIATNLRAISLERHEADIAIRIDRPGDGDMIARSIGSIHYGFYGTDQACRRVEAGSDPAFIGFNEADAFVPEAGWLARQFPRARLVLRANNHVAQAIAARSGAGLVLLPHYIGRNEPALRPIDLGAAPAPRDLFILTRRRDRTALAIRVISDEIVRIFATERALFQ